MLEVKFLGECNEVLEDELAAVLSIQQIKNSAYFFSLQSSYTEDGNGNGDFDRRRSTYFKRLSTSSSYLYSVVLEVSPILDKPMDLKGFMGLNIVVLSTEKYRLVRPLVIQDAMS